MDHMLKVVALGIDFRLSEEAILALRGAGAEVIHTSGADIEELARLTRDADAVMASLVKVPAPVIAQMERCKLLAAIGVGFDHIDFRAARERGIPVTHVPDYGTNEVADHALSLALCLARDLRVLEHTVRDGRW